MAKIAVVGCGAMGSVYAALMVDAGHEVHAVTLWPDHAEAMASKGLRCEGASGDRTVPLHTIHDLKGVVNLAALVHLLWQVTEPFWLSLGCSNDSLPLHYLGMALAK